MSTKQGKKRRRSLSSRCLKALKVSTNFGPKTVFEQIWGKIWMDFPPHGFLLLVLVKCLRELLRLRGLSGSSEEFEFDSVDLRLSLCTTILDRFLKKRISFCLLSFINSLN